MFIIPKLSIISLIIILGSEFSLSNNLLKIFGILSFIIGSLGLFYQFNLQRFLAYSGLTHLGFILLIGNNMSYILIYILSLIGLLYCLQIKKIKYIYELTGLNNPPLYLIFSILILSLAGLPPFLGFFAKYLLCIEMLKTGNNIIVILIILFSILSCYRYIKMILPISYNNNSNNYLKIDQLSSRIITTIICIIIFSI